MALRLLIVNGLVAQALLLPAAGRAAAPAKDAPVLLYSLPLVARPAAAVKLTLRGQRLEKLKAVSCKDPKVQVKLLGPGKKADKPQNAVAAKVGESQCDVELSFAKDHSPAAVELRAESDAGVSTPYTLRLVPNLVPEASDTSTFDKAQKLTDSAAVSGAIRRPKESDLYRIDAAAGDQWQVVVQAQALGSPADLLLTVFDPTRQVVAIVDDSGTGSDPTLRFTAKTSGSYTLLLMEANDLGAPCFGYLLTVQKSAKR